jgi:hypothetical protein
MPNPAKPFFHRRDGNAAEMISAFLCPPSSVKSMSSVVQGFCKTSLDEGDWDEFWIPFVLDSGANRLQTHE